LSFSSRTAFGVEVIGRLHRDQAQKLHHVVLDHVAHGAGIVVIFAAPAHADGFGHGDLDVIDILRVPERFEQDIGEAHRHQVLDGFLAQIMVDPVDLIFGEMPRQRGVQRAPWPDRGQRAFPPRSGCRHRRCRFRQPFGQIAKQRRRDREIEGPGTNGRMAQRNVTLGD
jgi:hypothetical protein